ncbi:MAG: hypothetical protein IJH38_01905 [Clostridia bacterium]|nr:hypothetical protein [Clostridia bacterium]
MTKRRKKNPKPGRGRKITALIFLVGIVLVALLAGLGYVNASIVRLRRAEVFLQDLPRSFEGTTLLFVSDIDLCGSNDAEKSGALFEKLQALDPDLLILGGGYCSRSLVEILNRPHAAQELSSHTLAQRKKLFDLLAGFQAPLGKFCIASPEDLQPEDLSRCMEDAGFQPLFDTRRVLSRQGESLWLAGIVHTGAHLNSIGSAFEHDEAVIAIAYSPSLLPILLTSESIDGGPWADLLLCGHTHGGQVRLFGQCLLPLNDTEKRFLSGWIDNLGLPVLVTQGIGCKGINLRLGTTPEAWFITLRCT